MAAREPRAAARLFAVPLRDFTQVRDALVRELRAKGETDEAAAVAKLRKPPVALWIANQLARLSPGEVKALVEATALLRKAQPAGSARGDALREAMRQQREALARLADAAGRAALEAETRLTPELRRRVQSTVQAAAASEPEALLEGSLAAELQPSGFEGLLDAAPASVRARVKEGAAARAREKERARALHEAEQTAHRLDVQAKDLAEIAAAREQEAARSRERADLARREADEAAARAAALRER